MLGWEGASRRSLARGCRWLNSTKIISALETGTVCVSQTPVSTMSSWKVETRAHRERAQPKGRARMGLLEKHGDYKKRAVAHHKKADRLRSMKLKAEMRNPDEFYFGMVHTKTKVRAGPISAPPAAGT